jgi:hypothetical protein
MSGAAGRALRGEAHQTDLMVAYEVSWRVNSPENNDAAPIEPVAQG